MSGGSHEALHRGLGSEAERRSCRTASTTTSTSDNPVRVIDAFVDMLDLAALGFDVEPEATGRPGYHPATMLEDLPLRLPQPGAVVAPARARVRAQSRADLADRPAEARLQDDRRFPPRQRSCHPQGLPAVRRALPRHRSARRQHRRDRRQQVQGRQRQGEELHAREARRRMGEIDAAIARYLGELDRADEVARQDRHARRRMRGCRA